MEPKVGSIPDEIPRIARSSPELLRADMATTNSKTYDGCRIPKMALKKQTDL